jgi:guanine nucleotide-binding protein G(i) subunit alpha
MRLIHQSDYTLEERLMYKPIVYANAIQSMSIILNAVEKLSIAAIKNNPVNYQSVFLIIVRIKFVIH